MNRRFSALLGSLLCVLLLAPARPPAVAAPAPRNTARAEVTLDAAMRMLALGRLREGRSLFLHLAEEAARQQLQPEVERFALQEAARLSLRLEAPADALRIWETLYARHAAASVRRTLCQDAVAVLTTHAALESSLRSACGLTPRPSPAPVLSDLPGPAMPGPDLAEPDWAGSGLPVTDAPTAADTIRLRLAAGPTLTITLRQTVACRTGGEELLLPPGRWILREQAGQIACTAAESPGTAVLLGSDLQLEVPERGLILHDGADHRYGGAFRLLARPGQPGRVDLVLRLALEDYVTGVLLGEMPASWPAEALKAQAVAARTYALAQRRQASRDWDLLDDTRDQRYLPPAPGTPRLADIRAAVAATRGMVLTHQGQLFAAYYHAHSGGRLEAANAELPGPAAVFPADTDPAGADLPGLDWTLSLPAAAVLRRTMPTGVSEAAAASPPLVGIAVGERTAGGRARTVLLRTPQGTTRLDAAAFRRALNLPAFKSLLCDIRLAEGVVYITGRGHGHGVGMSQYGAARLAAQGLPFDAILARYYHQTALARLAFRPESPEAPGASGEPGLQTAALSRAPASGAAGQ